MNTYISNKRNQPLALECDEQMVPLREIPFVNGSIDLRSKAFYISEPAGYLGVFSSKAGPIFFVNGTKYLFDDSSWNVSVIEGPDTNRFELLVNGETVLSYTYTPVVPDPVDPWSDKLFEDFHLWLASKRNDRELIRMWTDQ